MKYVPSISVNLKKLCDINELSRRIEQENLSIDTAFERLQEIQKAKNEPVWELVFSSGVGAAAFGYLFGGSLWDCLAAFVCGVILQLFFSFLDEKQVNISKVLLDIIGGLLVTVICVVLNRIGVSEHLDLAITGAIIPIRVWLLPMESVTLWMVIICQDVSGFLMPFWYFVPLPLVWGWGSNYKEEKSIC